MCKVNDTLILFLTTFLTVLFLFCNFINLILRNHRLPRSRKNNIVEFEPSSQCDYDQNFDPNKVF